MAADGQNANSNTEATHIVARTNNIDNTERPTANLGRQQGSMNEAGCFDLQHQPRPRHAEKQGTTQKADTGQPKYDPLQRQAPDLSGMGAHFSDFRLTSKEKASEGICLNISAHEKHQASLRLSRTAAQEAQYLNLTPMQRFQLERYTSPQPYHQGHLENPAQMGRGDSSPSKNK